jgi:hypothetical protein
VTRRRWIDGLTFCGLAGLLALVTLSSPRWAPWLRGTSPGLGDGNLGPEPQPSSVAPIEPPPVERRISVTLFFASPDRPGLALEERTVAFSGDLARQIQVVVEELLQGSTTGLLAPLPQGARVLDVFVGAGGVAYVNLDPVPAVAGPIEPIDVGEEGAGPPPTPAPALPADAGPPLPIGVELGIQGSTEELLAVYSIVDSIVINLPAVRRVQILIRGEPVDTLAGHVDISRPLAADASLLLDLGAELSPEPVDPSAVGPAEVP